MENKKPTPTEQYFKILDRLYLLRKNGASDFEIECTKIEEAVAWEDLEKLHGTDTYCR